MAKLFAFSVAFYLILSLLLYKPLVGYSMCLASSLVNTVCV